MMITGVSKPPPGVDDNLGNPGEVGNRSIRERLARLIDESGEGYAAISRLIGRNPAYIQQFIRRGVPRRLSETDRRLIASHFGIDEHLLGAPPAATISPAGSHPVLSGGVLSIPFLGDKPETFLKIDRQLIERLHSELSVLAALIIDCDSMAPTLMAGDSILIDLAGRQTLRDGIFVIASDSGPLVKRLSVHPITGRVAILADNPAYPDFPDCDPQTIKLIGRVVWVARSLG